MPKKNFVAVILIIIMVLIHAFTSCRNSIDAINEEAIVFTDALGRRVSVKKNPQRVASLLGSFSDVWVLAGGKLCASAEDAWYDFGLELDDAVDIGGAHSPSLELLISSEPELVLASASTASNVEMRESLESMGITVAYFEVNSFYDYLDMLDICTDITGRKDLYEQNGLALKTQIDLIKKQYNNIDIPQNERKVLILRAASSFVKAKGSSGTILGEMLEDIGCINIADNNTDLLENLSAEAVIQEEPYHIFVVTMGNDTYAAEKSFENMIKENPAWSRLTAVEEGRVHMMEKKLFNLKPNSEWAQAYEILYEKLTKE